MNRYSTRLSWMPYRVFIDGKVGYMRKLVDQVSLLLPALHAAVVQLVRPAGAEDIRGSVEPG